MDCPSCGTGGFYVGLCRKMEDGFCENRDCLYYEPSKSTSGTPKDPDEVVTKVEKKPSGMKIKRSGMKIKTKNSTRSSNPYGWPGSSNKP